MTAHSIHIRGARTHNLRGIDVEIPHRRLTVITGVSGSGKSSLAFDTLYAEGQRRFVESMSTYVRQFLERMERPDVDEIENILPAIAIEQRNTVKNARSTVATATELADYVRLFLTWCGETWCPDCNHQVRRESPESVTSRVMTSLDGARVIVAAPLFFEPDHRDAVVAQLAKGGFVRIWVDGKIEDLTSFDLGDTTFIDVVVGRLQVKEENRSRVAEAIEQSFSIARGLVNVLEDTPKGWESHRFSSRFSCDRCGREFQDPTPHLFSFNSPLGACESCQGYGRVIGIDLDKVVPDRSLTLDENPIAAWNSEGYQDCYDDLRKAAAKHKVRMTVPVKELTPAEWDVVYAGRGSWYGIKGFFDWLETKKYKIHVRVKLAKFRSYEKCLECEGSRLRREAHNVRFRDQNVVSLFSMNVGAARRFWEYLPLTKQEEAVAGHLRREVLNRLVYLDEVGLSYLTLDRQTRTLSGGEAQRINLAAALGSGLTETLYVIDEPTVGLHARDSSRLLTVLHRLRNAGNTVVVVEHDPLVIRGADEIVELGPGAGELGGQLVWTGKPPEWEVRQAADTDDGPPIESMEEPRASRSRRHHDGANSIRILGASGNNLKEIDVEIPLDRLVAVAGVSGSGKSTLIRDCLFNGYQKNFRAVPGLDVGRFRKIEGVAQIDDIQLVDQSPIGRSTRSNPATYVKAWDEIRQILAETTGAKLNGITPGMFSFNTAGGRCDACEGAGTVVIDMQFLADVEVTCEKCNGRRFGDRVLKVRYKGASADDILRMTIDDAFRFFVDKRKILKRLHALRSVGLGYLRLGQSTASLSGGEAQRLKLASFLVGTEKTKARRLFLFDEPTTGLSTKDVRQLLRTFRDLIAHGNSVLVIEHNLEMIEACDWVIELGPDGGDGGGYLIAKGTPADLVANPESVTGKYLQRA
ncbi:MAG: excinuclease ABC subunit UvrA [Thermoanaerobaculia bacterium]|nr:excinuclease ABC subunit UvrA [Thermoanaerobaculia bacterium]